MKKKHWFFVLAVAALLFTACGRKEKTETESSAGGDATEEPSSEALEESSVYAYIRSLDGQKLTAEVEDGTSMAFDIASADVNPAWELMDGDYVEIYYEGSEPVDGMAVTRVVMMEPYELTDESLQESPFLYGRIEEISDKSLSLREMLDERDSDAPPAEDGEDDIEAYLGETYTFARAPYEKVLTEGGVEPGVFASVYYLGELSEDPISYWVCTDDMMEDEEASMLSLRGTLDAFTEGVAYLKTSDGTVFKFNTNEDEALIKAAEENVGKEVEISFSDSILQRVMTAETIKPVK